jgi:hypothetical protein
MENFTQKLFKPIQIGQLLLEHRVVMSPLTRSRSQQPGDIPGALMQQYYTQRASKGGFVVSEATTTSPSAKGWFGAPGIYTDDQVAGWRKITAAIHAKGAFIFRSCGIPDGHRTSIPAASRRLPLPSTRITCGTKQSSFPPRRDGHIRPSTGQWLSGRSVSAGRSEQAHGRLWWIH